MKFNPALQKEMEEKRRTKKISGYTETRCGYTSTCVLEKKCDKLCEMKEEIKKVVVGSDFFFQETTTKVTLKLTLEPLFFFALEFLQNDRLNISSFCGICFGITTALRTLWH